MEKDKFLENLKKLVELGKSKKGALDMNDINEYFAGADLSVEQMADWAAAMGIESVVIDQNTTIRDFKNELKWNAAAYR